jgi:hypothetical protein
MKTQHQHGSILIVTLIMIVVVSGFVILSLNVTNGSTRLADRSRDFTAAQVAAEGAVEYGFGIWKKRLNNANSSIPSTSLTDVVGPSFSDFAYASAALDGPLKIDPLDEYGTPSATAVPVLVDVLGYPGWRGKSYTYAARAKLQMSPKTYNFEAGVKRLFQYSSVPLFQAMYFFEDNLEFYKPATMIVSGLVHTNHWAYLSGTAANPLTGAPATSLTFQDEVSYVEGYTHTADPPFANTWGGWSANATVSPIYEDGIAAQLHQVARIEPLGAEPAMVINTTDSNQDNDGFRELIEPPVNAATDPPEFAKRRFYNKAGIRMTINGASVTVTAQNGTSLTAAKQTAISSAVTTRTTMYDQREGKNVDVATVDVGLLTTALNAGVTGFNDVLYIQDATPINAANPEPKTVRLTNGGVLPDRGLTVVSENPIYIKGDYNTGTTINPALVPSNSGGNVGNLDLPVLPGYTRKPSSVMSDAVMLLSNSWSDSNASNTDVNSRVASHTTYNTAIVSGFMPSGYQPPTGAQYGYSGGANNFPRFLENWDGKYCTYYGSMVELYKSKIFTAEWDTGVIYRPPLRCWNFDTSFRDNPPPGSLDAASFSRGTWARY